VMIDPDGEELHSIRLDPDSRRYYSFQWRTAQLASGSSARSRDLCPFSKRARTANEAVPTRRDGSGAQA
jgi:hypothetical protein